MTTEQPGTDFDAGAHRVPETGQVLADQRRRGKTVANRASAWVEPAFRAASNAWRGSALSNQVRNEAPRVFAEIR